MNTGAVFVPNRIRENKKVKTPARFRSRLKEGGVAIPTVRAKCCCPSRLTGNEATFSPVDHDSPLFGSDL